MLDGEGGYTVVGQADAGRRRRSRMGGLPLGLAHGVKVLRPVAAGQPVRWSDVAVDANSTAVRVRREMEASIRADAGRLDEAAPALDLLADELR